MDNNLPKDPPNSGNGAPPPFGSNFDPHTNPVDPNNPYATPSQPPPPPNPTPPQQPSQPKPHGHILTEEEKHKLSELAKHRARLDGHFAQSSNIPPIIEVNKNTEPSDKTDPPLFGLFITNPVTYLKLFLKRLLKRQAITLRIPVLALIIIMVGIGGYGVGFQSGINWALFRLFPNSSPILHRSITEQGTILKNKRGEYFLKSDNKKDDTLWTLKSVSANVKLEEYVDKQVQIKGNLTPTPNLIEVSEIISFDTKVDQSSANAESSPASQTNTVISNPSTDTLTTSSTEPTNPNVLPALYSNIKWEAPKNKTLTFTSGTRKIEQDVIYIESLQVNTYPQDFISYYTQQLTNSGFKQTLNSQEPNNISITYSKDNLFLTFGIKNIYSGTGESKQIVGYKAYIEHN